MSSVLLEFSVTLSSPLQLANDGSTTSFFVRSMKRSGYEAVLRKASASCTAGGTLVAAREKVSLSIPPSSSSHILFGFFSFRCTSSLGGTASAGLLVMVSNALMLSEVPCMCW